MAIEYNKELNSRLRREVRNFNKRRNRAIAKGYKDIPKLMKVSDLKARYTTKRALEKELNVLSKFRIEDEDLQRKVENEGGATTTKWNLNYLKANTASAKDFFLREYKILSKRVKDFPSERTRMENLMNKINTLDLDYKYMNQAQFRTYQSAIKEFIDSSAKQRGGYRGFLSEIETVMRMVGSEEKSINRILNKVKELTPIQFTKMIQENDLVSRIYELADSPVYTGGTLKLNTTPEDAKELIDIFVEEVDDIVEEAKKEPEAVYIDPLDEFTKSMLKKPTKERKGLTKEGKIPLSSLSPKDVINLKKLGWGDLIDETK